MSLRFAHAGYAVSIADPERSRGDAGPSTVVERRQAPDACSCAPDVVVLAQIRQWVAAGAARGLPDALAQQRRHRQRRRQFLS